MSVLMEVTPSPANIALPPEAATEQWMALDGGGFARYDGVSDVTQLLSRATCNQSNVRKTIRKPTKKPVQFYVDHCENTACCFPYGHAGLCSHQIVTGKRGGRVSRYRPVSPFFDLNDSD